MKERKKPVEARSIYTSPGRVQTRATGKVKKACDKARTCPSKSTCRNYNTCPPSSRPQSVLNPSAIRPSIRPRQIILGRFVSPDPPGQPATAADWPGNMRRLLGLAAEPWSRDAGANQSGACQTVLVIRASLIVIIRLGVIILRSTPGRRDFCICR